MPENPKKSRRRRGSSAAAAADALLPSLNTLFPGDRGARPLPPAATTVIAADMTDEEKALMASARDVLVGVEQRMTALVRAASERWNPRVSVLEVDETSTLVFSDEEYADVLSVVEAMSEAQLLRAIAKFVQLPEAMVEGIVQERLRNRLEPHAGRRGIPFVLKQGQKPPQE